MTSRWIHRVLVCQLISEWTCGCCSYRSPIQGCGQKGGELPRVMNLDLRAVGQGMRLAPDGKMPASLGQPFVVKTECLHRVSSRGGPSSKTGLRSQRECECVREGAVIKSRRGQSEVADMQAKQGQVIWFWVAWSYSIDPGWARKASLYTFYSTCSERGRGIWVSAAGDRPHGIVTIGGNELNGLWSVCVTFWTNFFFPLSTFQHSKLLTYSFPPSCDPFPFLPSCDLLMTHPYYLWLIPSSSYPRIPYDSLWFLLTHP